MALPGFPNLVDSSLTWNLEDGSHDRERPELWKRDEAARQVENYGKRYVGTYKYYEAFQWNYWGGVFDRRGSEDGPQKYEG